MANVSVKFHKETGTATIDSEDGEITLFAISPGEQERAVNALLLGREVRAMEQKLPLCM